MFICLYGVKMKQLIVYFIFLLTVNTSLYSDDIKTISAPTTIDVRDFIESLSLEESLVILSIGKIKQVTTKPHITLKLQKLQEQINASFDQLYADQLAQYNLSQDAYENLKLAFQQKAVLMLYTLLYTHTKKLISVENSQEDTAIFNFQLTPEELDTYLSQ